MYQLFKSKGIKVLFLSAFLVVLACSSTEVTPAPAPAFDPTKAALELQATAMNLQLTQAALNQQQQPIQVDQPPAVQPTEPPAPQPVNAPTEPPQVQPTPTRDVEARIKAAKILVYENTDEYGIGMWVKDALDGMGLKYTQTGSYSGRFMEYLDSGVKYDLIIVDAEGRGDISGEFWDVINTRLTHEKVALITEMWYLHSEANGPISKILSGCGIRYQKPNPNGDSVYWWDPENEIFNEPNTVLPLVHNYTTYWYDGDRISLRGGDAELLAGNSSRPQNDGGVLASCYQGRMIIQTFADHNHPQSDIIPLWQNYIHYTLKNHFAVVP